MVEKLKNNYWLLLILLLAAALRFYHIDFQSIWLDECITMRECSPKLSIKESYDIMSLRENNPLLYYFLVKAVVFIFGYSTYVVRFLAALIGVFGVYAIYLLGKELQNKRTGLIAASLFAVNHFHLWYSQEIRPYGLLTALTLLSFYRLVIFIKNNSFKNAILYGIFTALMINTHFFGLFVLVAQAVIVLVFAFDIEKYKVKSYLIKATIAGIIAFVLWFIPSWKIFLIAAEIKVFWIPIPAPDVFTSLFKEFFGNAESVVFMAGVMALFYFFGVFRAKAEKNALKSNPSVLGFIVISIWIFITLFIPLVRSYTQIPMIVSRYLIVVLPAILLIMAIAINNIANSAVRKIILVVFIVSSLTDIIIVKDYYNKIQKAQLREITGRILKRNIQKDKVVTPCGFVLGYFLNPDESYPETIESGLKAYVDSMQSNAMPTDSFWYLEGTNPYNLTPEEEQFLADKFYVREDIKLFDTWTKHYISKTPKQAVKPNLEVNIKDFVPLNVDGNGNMVFFENSTVKSSDLLLAKGKYTLTINANSLPAQPLKGENAHFIVKINEEKIGDYFLSENPAGKEKIISFECASDKTAKIVLVYDNDLSIDGVDRNAIVYSIKLDKK